MYRINTVCFKYIIVNTMRKGDNKYSSSNNNNNNKTGLKFCAIAI